MVYEGQLKLFHPHHHHLRHLISSVGIEVGVVGQCLGLTREGIGRIMHQRQLAALVAERLEEGARHVVQLYDGHTLALGHGTHGIGIVTVRLLYLAVRSLIEGAALGGSREEDVATLLAHLINEYLEVVGEVVPSTCTCEPLLLVVVTKLAHHIVARLHHSQHFLQTVGGQERAGGEAALRMIGDGHLGSKPSRNHLSPTGIRLVGLVHDGGVATEEEGHGRRVRLYSHLFHGRGCPGKLQGELLIPSEIILLAGLDLHAHLFIDVRAAFVDDKGEGLELTLLGSDLVKH